MNKRAFALLIRNWQMFEVTDTYPTFFTLNFKINIIVLVSRPSKVVFKFGA